MVHDTFWHPISCAAVTLKVLILLVSYHYRMLLSITDNHAATSAFRDLPPLARYRKGLHLYSTAHSSLYLWSSKVLHSYGSQDF